MTTPLRLRPSVMSTALIGGVLALCGGAAGYFAVRYVNPALFSGLLKYAIGIVGIVWLFSLTVYNKLWDSTDMAGLDYRQHRHLEVEIRARLNWFWMRAMFLAILALLLYTPSILTDAKLAVPAWVFGAACAALLLALFSLRRLWAELEEIRELRSHIKELERREAEREKQVKTLKDGVKSGWDPDPRLSGFRDSVPPDPAP
jgi:cell division protein FtsB